MFEVHKYEYYYKKNMNITIIENIAFDNIIVFDSSIIKCVLVYISLINFWWPEYEFQAIKEKIEFREFNNFGGFVY